MRTRNAGGPDGTVMVCADTAAQAAFLPDGPADGCGEFSGPWHDVQLEAGDGGNVGWGWSVFPEETVVYIEALPRTGYCFVRWTGDTPEEPTEASTTLEVDGPKYLRAEFAEAFRVYDAQVVGGGTVACNLEPGLYPVGTQVTYTATPDSGWEFDGWSYEGASCASDTLITSGMHLLSLPLECNVQPMVVFDLQPYKVEVIVEPAGSGTAYIQPDETGHAKEGETVFLSVNPAEGYSFDRWESSDAISWVEQGDGLITFTMPNVDCSFIAYFSDSAKEKDDMWDYNWKPATGIEIEGPGAVFVSSPTVGDHCTGCYPTDDAREGYRLCSNWVRRRIMAFTPSGMPAPFRYEGIYEKTCIVDLYLGTCVDTGEIPIYDDNYRDCSDGNYGDLPGNSWGESTEMWHCSEGNGIVATDYITTRTVKKVQIFDPSESLIENIAVSTEEFCPYTNWAVETILPARECNKITSHVNQGYGQTLIFDLKQDAEIDISVKSEAGNDVFHFDAGTVEASDIYITKAYVWTGKISSTESLPFSIAEEGDYTFEITATARYGPDITDTSTIDFSVVYNTDDKIVERCYFIPFVYELLNPPDEFSAWYPTQHDP